MSSDELLKQLNHYKKLCYIDDLTKLHNYRKLTQDIKRCIAENKRYNTKYVAILIDIDGFKHINDTKGHLYGNKVLKKVSQILQQNVREVDRLYRYGGDEFIILLGNDSDTRLVINRIEEKLKLMGISISWGCSLIKENILKAIDTKMYRNKHDKSSQ